jgi:hypothetical protein
VTRFGFQSNRKENGSDPEKEEKATWEWARAVWDLSAAAAERRRRNACKTRDEWLYTKEKRRTLVLV